MTKNFLFSLLIFAILQCSMSQSVTCPDGTFPSLPTPFNPVPDPDHGLCTKCHFTCKTCTRYFTALNTQSCTAYIDSIKGYEASTMKTLCYSRLFKWSFGYSSKTDSCLRCIEGCHRCVIDYDVCVECKMGWDYDVKNRKCIRASLGIAASVVGLSVLVLVLAVTTCICAMKI